ncbi:PepSY-associated TM helix domain-containing protein [Paenibacillus doosanensis]|uniref:PepSY-associated TM helix domain-containing protein n=1 Tax=Paenibacillus doosanensis TaxID=1229154 RepID=UPI0021804BF2|nr:PepSY-associated TM helix domain-containing protein [Paenibacillus doosanensis]MCS7461580.1 PepSY-associated TM helix domain-containing protein [Paenibacillus doosanensis]
MKGAASSGGGQQGKPAGGFGQQGNSFVGFIHGLHEGRVGSVNVKWLADVTAVGLIILTVTGISLSLQTLRAQRRSRNKRAAESLHR